MKNENRIGMDEAGRVEAGSGWAGRPSSSGSDATRGCTKVTIIPLISLRVLDRMNKIYRMGLGKCRMQKEDCRIGSIRLRTRRARRPGVTNGAWSNGTWQIENGQFRWRQRERRTKVTIIPLISLRNLADRGQTVINAP